jgi:hypothetical protein
MSSPSFIPPPSESLNKNSLNIFFNQEQFQIIKKYKLLHRLLFKHGIYALMIIVGIIGIFFLTKGSYPTIIQQTNTSQLASLVEAWKQQTQSTSSTSLALQIPYGTLTSTPTSFTSMSNLATYQDIVLPRMSTLPLNTTLSSTPNTPEELSQLINQLIFSSASQSYVLPENTPLKLSKGIISDFNLACLSEKKLSPIICSTFLENLYTYGMLYNL